jgi:hypothetical protein
VSNAIAELDVSAIAAKIVNAFITSLLEMLILVLFKKHQLF